MNVDVMIRTVTRDTAVLVAQLAATHDESGLGTAPEAVAGFVRLVLDLHGPMSRPALRDLLGLDRAELELILAQLIEADRICDAAGVLCSVAHPAFDGWMANVADHYLALVDALNEIHRWRAPTLAIAV